MRFLKSNCKIIPLFAFASAALPIEVAYGQSHQVISGEHVVQYSKYRVRSWISKDVRLMKIAEHATRDKRVQNEIDSLIVRFAEGALSPGMGNLVQGNGYVELRGAQGGRVIIKVLSDVDFAVVGKSAKSNNSEAEMFIRLRTLYEDFPKFTGSPTSR